MSSWGSCAGFWALRTALSSCLLIIMGAYTHEDCVPTQQAVDVLTSRSQSRTWSQDETAGSGHSSNIVNGAGLLMWQRPMVHGAIKHLTVSV